MNERVDASGFRPAESMVLARLRAATANVHRRLETRLDAVGGLADSARRPELLRRYAALHIPGEAALAPRLVGVRALDFPGRRRTPLLAAHAAKNPPAFPAPEDTVEALGMLYVLEGSTLGGRMILRDLAARGVDDPALAFLDPYGARTGAMWRGFLAVLARETGASAGRIERAARGALAAFRHAECVLCGEAVE